MKTRALAKESRGDYARIVEDDELVASEKVGESREMRIFKLATAPFDDEEARGVAAVEGTLGD